MNTVVDRLVEIWKQDKPGCHPDAIPRNIGLSAIDALSALAVFFPQDRIEDELERFLFKVVESYDAGELPYKQGTSVGLALRSRAILCSALVGETVNLRFSRHLLQEMIRAFPVLEWYQTLRTVIESRVAKADVLYALSEGLHSKRMAQVKSSTIGLAYYAEYSQQVGGTSSSIDHAVLRIHARLDDLLRRPSLPSLLVIALKAGKRHVEKWR